MSLNWRDILMLVLAVAIATIRVVGDKSMLFQAIAHCFVGFAFGTGIQGRKLDLIIAGALTVTEVLCFLLLRG